MCLIWFNEAPADILGDDRIAAFPLKGRLNHGLLFYRPQSSTASRVAGAGVPHGV
jgi:hypothetical protein